MVQVGECDMVHNFLEDGEYIDFLGKKCEKK